MLVLLSKILGYGVSLWKYAVSVEFLQRSTMAGQLLFSTSSIARFTKRHWIVALYSGLRRIWWPFQEFSIFNPSSFLSYKTSAGMFGLSLLLVQGSNKPFMYGFVNVGSSRSNTLNAASWMIQSGVSPRRTSLSSTSEWALFLNPHTLQVQGCFFFSSSSNSFSSWTK